MRNGRMRCFVITDPLTQLNRKKLWNWRQRAVAGDVENNPMCDMAGSWPTAPRGQAEETCKSPSTTSPRLKGIKSSSYPLARRRSSRSCQNLQPATQLGAIPPAVLARAERVSYDSKSHDPRAEDEYRTQPSPPHGALPLHSRRRACSRINHEATSV